MERFRNWRRMTWALLLWSAGGLVFMVVGGVGLSAIAIVALGLIVLGFIWYMTRAPWRVGHGARLRQMRSVEIPFKRPKSVTQD
jgi:hypothetical protein